MLIDEVGMQPTTLSALTSAVPSKYVEDLVDTQA